jgi:hypothetical protein
MNTDGHKAAEPPPKSLAAEAEPAEVPSLRAQKNPFQRAQDFRFSSTDPCSSVVPFMLLAAVTSLREIRGQGFRITRIAIPFFIRGGLILRGSGCVEMLT